MKSILSQSLVMSFTATACYLMLSGCASSTKIGLGSERKQLLLTSQQKALIKADKQQLEFFKGQSKVFYTSNDIRAVEIINKIIPHANHYYTHENPINWVIHVDKRIQKINAGALANGLIVLSPHFFQINLSDDQLAYVIAHEMAHVIRQHHRELVSWKRIISPVAIGASIVTGGTTMVAGLGARDTYSIMLNKEIEKEADDLGLELIYRAGFNIENAINVFQIIEPIYLEHYPITSKAPSMFKSHPSMKRRHLNSKKLLAYLQTIEPGVKNDNLTANNLIKPKLGVSKKFKLKANNLETSNPIKPVSYLPTNNQFTRNFSE